MASSGRSSERRHVLARGQASAATDSLVSCDGKLYHGAATFGGFYPFNFAGTREEREAAFADLSRLRITALDFFSALVFLVVALADASIKRCLFPDAGPDVRELLVNLPLGAACS